MTEPTARRSSDPRTRTRAVGGVVRGVLVSLAIHGGIAAAILGTAWGVARAQREEAPPVVLVADFFDPAPARPNPRAKTETDTATEPQPTNAPAREHAADLAAKLRALEQASAPSPELDGLARRFGALSPSGAGAGASSSSMKPWARSCAAWSSVRMGRPRAAARWTLPVQPAPTMSAVVVMLTSEVMVAPPARSARSSSRWLV